MVVTGISSKAIIIGKQLWLQFWDNRVGKRNPKAPDFKHKQGGQALWLSDAPQHILDQLQVILSYHYFIANALIWL